jgi:hypothetical protein
MKIIQHLTQERDVPIGIAEEYDWNRLTRLIVEDMKLSAE